MNVQELADDIIQKRNQLMSMKLARYPRNNLILSDISDCDRCNVYSVANWQDRKMFGVDVVLKLEEGNLKEKHIISELLTMGFQVLLQAEPVEIKNRAGVMIARGKIDGKIKTDNKIIPFEIKSMSENIFNGIHTVDDFKKKPYLRKYTYQLLMYMFGNNVEEGLFILECRNSWKLIPIYLDYGKCEWILQKLERAHEHIQAKTYPDRILYDQSMCGNCNFSLICLQDVINQPAEMIENQELNDTLDRIAEIKPISKEYDELYDKVKNVTKTVDKLIVNGNWILQNVPSQRTSYEVPEDIKKQYAVRVPVKRLVIEHLTEGA